MSETRRIANQLKAAFEGEAWHGPSVMEVLQGVTAERAAARPIQGAHTIWEIAAHIVTWEGVVLRRLSGEKVEVTTAEDWPRANEGGARAWADLLARLEQGNHALRKAILDYDDKRLDEPPAQNRSTGYTLMHGVIQHDLYHAGQIAVLKKGTSA